MAPFAQGKTGRTLLLIGRLVIAAVFLVAAYAKLHAPNAVTGKTLLVFPPVSISSSFFALQVDSYQMLPNWAVVLVARTLPWLELGVGVLLLTGIGLGYVGTVASVLLLFFFGVVVRTYAKGLEINCGCFGPGEKLGIKTLLRDGSILSLSLAVTAGAFISRRPSRLTSVPEGAAAKSATLSSFAKN